VERKVRKEAGRQGTSTNPEVCNVSAKKGDMILGRAQNVGIAADSSRRREKNKEQTEKEKKKGFPKNGPSHRKCWRERKTSSKRRAGSTRPLANKSPASKGDQRRRGATKGHRGTTPYVRKEFHGALKKASRSKGEPSTTRRA